jgi:hypothetical protein
MGNADARLNMKWTYQMSLPDLRRSVTTCARVEGITKTDLIPEFASFLILPLFFMATLLAAIIYRRKRCFFLSKNRKRDFAEKL